MAIYYFSLTSASLAVRRVKLRVVMGGNDVPEVTVHCRFGRSLLNFHSLYAPLADRWAIFDSSITGKAKSIATQEGDNLHITEPRKWLRLQKLLTTF